MRVPVKQRASRSSPASSRTKRRASSDGASPVKAKKRKPTPDAPPEAVASVTGVVLVPAKRAPIKKVPPKKGGVEAASGKVAAKKQKATKVGEPKPAMASKGKLVGKKVSVPAEKKIAAVKIPKKVAARTASTDGVVDVKEVTPPEKIVPEQASVAPKKPSKKATKSVAGEGKAKPKAKPKDESVLAPDVAKKKTVKKVGAKKVAEPKRAKVAPVGKARRKSDEMSPSMFADSPYDVIDEVARNTGKGVTQAQGASVSRKTKENEASKDGNSAIKSKVPASKGKKQLTKKTPKSVDESGAGKKGDDVGTEEAVDVELPDRESSDKETKSKVVSKKALKETKKPRVKAAKKKVMFKKSATHVDVGGKSTKVTFKDKEGDQQASKRPLKKSKKYSTGNPGATGTSFQDDYNSSTSDDCTLDLLLRRQKQLKQEDANATPSDVDVKPVKVEVSPPAVSPATKTKMKVKITSKHANAHVQGSKKLVAKGKTPSVVAKTTLTKLKMAAARKKAIVCKRMRSNEVSKLGSGSESEQRARRMKLFGFWSGPKRHRVASLNALAKVHCLYENESRGALLSICAKPPDDSSGGEEKPDVKTEAANTRTLRSGPGRRGIGQHWDQQTTSSSSSSEDNGHHSDASTAPTPLDLPPSYKQKQLKAKAAKPVKKPSKPRRHEAVMDLKDMVVRKRMASLNASAILSASYSPIEKLQKKQRGPKEDDSPPPVQGVEDDDSHVRKKKCKKKTPLSKKLVDGEDSDEEARNIIELATANNKKVATVIVNQDTDVTITGVYVNSTTHRSSTTHEGYCSIAGMQYLISSTSHTKTEARAVATETLLHAPAELVPPAPTLHPPETPMKTYTPLGALSIMQPPGGPLSPLARRHGCTSAFSAPPLLAPVPPPVPPSSSVPPQHHHHHHAAPTQETQAPPYIHGYYQPAGPLISAHHHQHSLPKASVLPPLEASPTSTPPTNAPSAPPPISASTSSGTRGGDESSDNDVVITASSCPNPTYPPAPPSQGAPTYRYQTYPLPTAPQHHQYGYPSQYPAPQYYPVAAGQGGGYAPAPPHYHNADLCYTAPSYPPAPQYYHKSYSTPPPVTYPRRYGPPPPPPPHPSQYYPAELYPPPPEQQAGRQMVATASSSYQQPPAGDAYPHPQQAPPPVVPMVDSYPPPPAPGYYPGYPPPAPPPCYSHSPPARSLAYIDTAYQGCPCPMQSCPKNVNTGPLTGEGKGPHPSAAYIHHLPLPPVALALPSEPPHAGGPPSPARGSAGMHPTPSPRLATAQGSDVVSFPAKREQATSESRAASTEQSSGDHVGLLAIHRPGAAPRATTLGAGTTAGAGTVNVSTHATLTRNGEPRVETKAVKVEAEEAVVGNARKRKMKAETPSPKPKKRCVKEATVASPKCESQPLSSANGCSVHHSKQNAKKRKLGDLERLAENQEPGEPAAKAKSKESKPNRPRLCPPSQTGRKTGVADEPVCDLTATTQVSNGVPVPAKSGQKAVRQRLTKCRLRNVQLQAPEETVLAVLKVDAPKRLPPKPKLGKAQSVPNCVLAEAGKVKNRRKTDSEVSKTSPMLRRHGIQDGWEPMPAVKSLPTATKGKASGATKKPSRKKVVPILDVGSMVLAPKRGCPLKPKWSNGWCWEGESFQGKVLLNSEGTSVERLCYPSMRHKEGDLIRPLDCVLLRSGARRADLPYVAKVAQLWENPDDGEMMVSLLWYYRPEHTDQGRRAEDMRDEIFASKHKDANSVACIEDKCYVLTFNEYCRYRAGSRRQQDGGRDVSAVVPLPPEYPRASRQPSSSVSPDMVFFCRRVYDFRQKRILKNPC